jgi:hypothetical protein
MTAKAGRSSAIGEQASNDTNYIDLALPVMQLK